VRLRVGVLTVSDRCSRGERQDLGGPAVAAAAEALGWEVVRKDLVSDDAGLIAEKLKAWCDGPGAPDAVLTTGGTGISPRDVTPEATRSVLEKELPGLAERMRRIGEASTPFAAISRGVCGTRGRTLLVNLPGSPKGAKESLEALSPVIPHAVGMLRGEDH
jgi:molybdopterin adenylyltransferase